MCFVGRAADLRQAHTSDASRCAPLYDQHMRVRLCAVSCATTRPHAPYRFPRTCTCRALASAACCQTSSATNPLSVWSKVDSFERLSRPAGATTEQMNVCEAPEVVRTSRRVGCAHLRSSRRQLAAEGVTRYQLQRAGRHTSVRAHHASGPSLTRCECNLRRVAHRVAGLRGCELLKSVGVSPSSRRRNLATRNLILLHAATLMSTCRGKDT